MKRAAFYCRVSTIDQHRETQLGELRQFAAHKGFQIVGEFTDHGFSGARARRPELDRMRDEARRHKFDVLLVWSCDRLARSTKKLLQAIDELNGMGIQFLSQRAAIETEGPLGRAILVTVSAMAELN
jgi:DNA invertase Pin-like site-specific DNA recombinase